jgi:polar amino acid transport system substrate-binding protein
MTMTLAHHHKVRLIGLGIIWFWALLFFPGHGFTQDDVAAPCKLLVGTMAAPPLYVKTADNQWRGFGIELWQAVAQHLNVGFEFREYSGLEPLLNAIKYKEIDVIPSLPVEEEYESIVDFSQSYLKSGLAIAVPAEEAGSRWMGVAGSIFSTHILAAVGSLLLLSLTAGIIVWAFERRRNSEMFGEGPMKGIGHGIWWSLVTMTTVGYGDKAPKTLGGRITAFIWMLFSIVFISGFTASITTSLTISELRGKVRGFDDLYKVRVGSIARSEAAHFLMKHGITVTPFESIHGGLAAVVSKKIDALVLNEGILKYLVRKEFPGRVQVIPGTFDEYFVSMALQDKSPLRKPINKALLKFMKTEEWSELMNRYTK